jgi:hypothetical protein
MKKLTFLMIAIVLSIGASMATDFDNGVFRFRTGGASGGVLVMGPSTAFTGGAFNIPTTATDPGTSTTYNVTELRMYMISKFTSPNLPTTITVPEGVVNIGVGSGGSFDASATSCASQLTAITLPSTITTATITDFTFNNLTALTDLTMKCATPPTISSTNGFYNVHAFTLHIPLGKTAVYAAAGWANVNNGGKIYNVTVVEDVTAINTVSASTISVRALSGNSFAVAGIDGKADVAIYELSGKRVATFTQVVNNDVLTNSNLKAGLYIVKLNNGANSTAAKLVFN